jgi:hypothetical protein
MKKQILCIVLLLSSAFAFAQIKMIPGYLTFGPTTPVPNYYITSWGGLFISGNSTNTNFLKIDVFNAKPRISGSGDEVIFLNSQTSTYNSIRVSSVIYSSDAKFKTNINPLKYGLNTVSKLRPVSYNLIKKPSGNKEFGLIAQELEQLIPELVFTDEEGKKLVNYNGLIPVLIKAVQELQQEVAELKAAK